MIPASAATSPSLSHAGSTSIRSTRRPYGPYWTSLGGLPSLRAASPSISPTARAPISFSEGSTAPITSGPSSRRSCNRSEWSPS
jgi:hypothetical protein